MLFNGKYYNKPGHLGMTRSELLEKLNGGGGGGGGYQNIDIVYGKETGGAVTISKSFNDILASTENNAVILILQTGDRSLLFDLVQSDGNHITFSHDVAQLEVHDEIVIFSSTFIGIAPDNTVSVGSEGPYKVSVTPYIP